MNGTNLEKDKKGVKEGKHKNSIKKGNARYILVRGKKLVRAGGKLHKKSFPGKE